LVKIKFSFLILKSTRYFMKKAQIMLMAVAVLAIVGGTLAFRATKTLTVGSCNIPAGLCNLNPVQKHFNTINPTICVTLAPIAQKCTTTATICGGAPGECTTAVSIDL
jgi:hypothetical protein